MHMYFTYMWTTQVTAQHHSRQSDFSLRAASRLGFYPACTCTRYTTAIEAAKLVESQHSNYIATTCTLTYSVQTNMGMCVFTEERLHDGNYLESHNSRNKYFITRQARRFAIEDDHVPFMNRGKYTHVCSLVVATLGP